MFSILRFTRRGSTIYLLCTLYKEVTAKFWSVKILSGWDSLALWKIMKRSSSFPWRSPAKMCWLILKTISLTCEIHTSITVKTGQAYPPRFYYWIDYLKNEFVSGSRNWCKFKSELLHAYWAVNNLRELVCNWSDWKSLIELKFFENIYIKFRETELVEIS